jgi:hypothetical protein
MPVQRLGIVCKMGVLMRIQHDERGSKVPCPATELPAQPGWTLPNLVGSWDVDALPFGIVGTLGPPGEVEGSGERYHEPRQHPELEYQVQELLRADGLLRFGGHKQDAPDDGYEPDQEERLGDDLPLRTTMPMVFNSSTKMKIRSTLSRTVSDVSMSGSAPSASTVLIAAEAKIMPTVSIRANAAP